MAASSAAIESPASSSTLVAARRPGRKPSAAWILVAEGHREVGRRVGADRHEAGVADRELAGEPVDQVQAHGQDDVDARQADHLAGSRGRSTRPGSSAARESPFATKSAATSPAAASSALHTFSFWTAPEEALRPQEQDEDQDREGDRVAVGRGEVAHDHDLRDADQQAAEDGARDVPDAAEHGRHERLQAVHDPHERVDLGDLHADEHARRRRERRAEGEGDRDDPVGGDPHQLATRRG